VGFGANIGTIWSLVDRRALLPSEKIPKSEHAKCGQSCRESAARASLCCDHPFVEGIYIARKRDYEEFKHARKQRGSFPTEARVKRGRRTVHGDKRSVGKAPAKRLMSLRVAKEISKSVACLQASTMVPSGTTAYVCLFFSSSLRHF
jgi:hypothetical protein